MQRKPILGLTWSGCAFVRRGILTYGRISLNPLPSLASRILGPETRTGSRLRLPVSGVRREYRGSVRGALPAVRTAKAVWSFDLRMHSRWSQSYLLSFKHTPFILLCAINCNTLKYWSRPAGIGRVDKGVFMCPQGREVDTQWAFYLPGHVSSTQWCCFTLGLRLSLLAVGSALGGKQH